jgi:hypothetical protein
MKNVVGLANAMRTVESACEKGEITIIGEGGLPSPVELYNKCVAFINRNYGVDILNLVAQTATKKDCGDCCCHTVIVDTKSEQIIRAYLLFDVDEVREYLDEILPELMPYVDEDLLDELTEDIVEYCEVKNENMEVNSLSVAKVADTMVDKLCDKFSNLSYNTCEEVGNEIGEYIMDNCAYLHGNN